MTKVQFEQEIDDKVFQSICLKSLAKINGIQLIEGNLLDTLFKSSSQEKSRGIAVTKEDKGLSVKLEVNVEYGIFLPQKAKEIQENIAKDLNTLTGFDVLLVNVVFKNIILDEEKEFLKSKASEQKKQTIEKEQFEKENLEFANIDEVK